MTAQEVGVTDLILTNTASSVGYRTKCVDFFLVFRWYFRGNWVFKLVWVVVDPWLMWHALFVGVQRYVTGKRLLVVSVGGAGHAG